MKEKVYVLHELYDNDGEIDSNVLCVSKSLEKCQEKKASQIDVYRTYGVFDEEDFECAFDEETETCFEISNDDYSASLVISEMELE